MTPGTEGNIAGAHELSLIDIRKKYIPGNKDKDLALLKKLYTNTFTDPVPMHDIINDIFATYSIEDFRKTLGEEPNPITGKNYFKVALMQNLNRSSPIIYTAIEKSQPMSTDE
jgi:hypothetical protein